MNEHITKPIDQNQLTEILLRWTEPLAPSAPRPQPAPRTAPAAHLQPSLPQSVYLDTAQALVRLGGSAELYRELLQTFLANHSDEAHRIAEALEQAQTADARRMAHTLKGTAATLGATALSACAAVLERAMLQQDEGVTAAALTEVKQGLEGLCADLNTFFAARV